MNASIINKIGLSHYNAKDFFPKKVKLRHGIETTIWIHRPSGHGVLDPEHWPIENYYEEEYREEFSANSSGTKVKTDEHFHIYRETNKKQFEVFSDLCTQKTNFLEIGPSHGGIIDLVEKIGVNEIHAIEPNTQDACYLGDKYPNCQIQNSTLEKADLKENFYDIAVSFEVLEHVLSPKTFLKKINKCLKKGASLVLEVPNHHDVLLSCYKKNNYKDFYYHKAHIHYFTPESLKDLCSEVGFTGEVTSFLMYPFFNHVYWTQNHGPQATAKDALSLPIPTEGNTQIEKQINKFYESVESQYEKMINSLMVGDCLMYKGKK